MIMICFFFKFLFLNFMIDLSTNFIEKIHLFIPYMGPYMVFNFKVYQYQGLIIIINMRSQY